MANVETDLTKVVINGGGFIVIDPLVEGSNYVTDGGVEVSGLQADKLIFNQAKDDGITRPEGSDASSESEAMTFTASHGNTFEITKSTKTYVVTTAGITEKSTATDSSNVPTLGAVVPFTYAQYNKLIEIKEKGVYCSLVIGTGRDVSNGIVGYEYAIGKLKSALEFKPTGTDWAGINLTWDLYKPITVADTFDYTDFNTAMACSFKQGTNDANDTTPVTITPAFTEAEFTDWAKGLIIRKAAV